MRSGLGIVKKWNSPLIAQGGNSGALLETQASNQHSHHARDMTHAEAVDGPYTVGWFLQGTKAITLEHIRPDVL